MDREQKAVDWRERAAQLAPATEAFIDGKYVPAVSGATFDCVNPATGKTIARVASCAAADVDLAVASARRAFEAGHWSRRAPAARKKVLLRFAELIRKHREELALTETLDMGKPITDSLKIDIPATANCIAWYAEAIDKVYDQVAPTSHDSLALITREPAGVVGAIVPWNFPLLMASWKLGPALATGNSVVLKPSEKSPLTALRIAALAMEAGLPEGVLNVVPGFGSTAGEPLALHMDVDCIAFTGSTRTGKRMLEYAGRSNMKRIWLECGGKAPNVVMGDVADLDRAANAAAFGIFFNQGEMCSAASRLVVHESVRDALLEKIVAVGRTMTPDDPLDPKTRLGAIVDQVQLDTVMGYIESGSNEGARLRLGGKRVREESGGYFVEPTVFDDVTPKMKIAREEIFGPVLVVVRVPDLDAALGLIEGHEYGNGAAIFTRDGGAARKFSRRVAAGMVGVNVPIPVPMAFHSFGGWKRSLFGPLHMHGPDGVRFYTRLKTVTARWPEGSRGAEFTMPTMK